MVQGAASQAKLIRLHLELRDITPPIWRCLLIPGDRTLYDLHRAIQVVMGWYDYHLHSFTIGKRRYEPESDEGDFFATGEPPIDDDTVAIGEVLKRKGQKLLYEYDFGDNWEIDGVVEAVLPPDPAVTAPVCLDGRRAGPLEDCGGTWGYQEVLESLQNPEDDDYWGFAEGYDPEEFDCEAMNRRLAETPPAN